MRQQTQIKRPQYINLPRPPPLITQDKKNVTNETKSEGPWGGKKNGFRRAGVHHPHEPQSRPGARIIVGPQTIHDAPIYHRQRRVLGRRQHGTEDGAENRHQSPRGRVRDARMPVV